MAGLSTAAFAGISSQFNIGSFTNKDLFEYTFASGLVGGITSGMSGGKFGHGFRNSAIGAYASVEARGLLGGMKRGVRKHAAEIIVAGTISEISGGKFANGAMSAAISSAFSDGATTKDGRELRKQGESRWFEKLFESYFGMTVERSIALYKAETGKDLSVDQVKTLFTDADRAKQILLADEQLHTVYRNILNTNVPLLETEAVRRGFTRVTPMKSIYHSPKWNPWQNSKWVGPNGHLEVVFNSEGERINDVRYKGTFNFFSPDNVAGHLAADVLPYRKWGN